MFWITKFQKLGLKQYPYNAAHIFKAHESRHKMFKFAKRGYHFFRSL